MKLHATIFEYEILFNDRKWKLCESAEIRQITSSDFKLGGFNLFEITVHSPDIDNSCDLGRHPGYICLFHIHRHRAAEVRHGQEGRVHEERANAHGH